MSMSPPQPKHGPKARCSKMSRWSLWRVEEGTGSRSSILLALLVCVTLNQHAGVWYLHRHHLLKVYEALIFVAFLALLLSYKGLYNWKLAYPGLRKEWWSCHSKEADDGSWLFAQAQECLWILPEKWPEGWGVCLVRVMVLNGSKT